MTSKGEELRLNAPLDKINLHLREGSIIPTQVKGFSAKTGLLQCWMLKLTMGRLLNSTVRICGCNPCKPKGILHCSLFTRTKICHKKKKTCENVQSADWPSASEAGAKTVNKGSVLCSG